MSLPRYPNYKASGVECLGDVPEGWAVAPFKREIVRNDGGVWGDEPDGINDTIVLRSTEQTVDGRWQLDAPALRKLTASEIDGALLAAGDLLLTKSSGSSLHIGKTTLVTAEVEAMRCCYSNFMQRIRTKKTFLPKLAWYVLNNELARKQLDLLSNTTTGLANLNATTVGQLVVVVPPLAEQTAIAEFLDRETGKIDELVAEQRRLMELLKEKRQAVISHAVTQGLNPHAPMKPSGIEWLGDVPEGWEVVPLKHLCVLLKDGTHLPPARVDDGIPLLSVRNLVSGKFVRRDDDSMISEEDYRELARAFVPKADDVLLAIVGATLGKTAVIPSGLGLFHIQRSIAIFRAKPTLLQSEFLNLVFQSRPFQALLWELVGYSAQPGIYLGTLQNIRIPVPSLSEQLAIALFLETELAKFDTLTAEAQLAINLLQERRTALISAAVTGQIDVRSYSLRH